MNVVDEVGAVVSPLIKGMARKVNSIIDERTGWTTNDVKRELKRIAAALQDMVAAVDDAELAAETDSEVSRWLRVLRDWVYGVDHLIDELQHIARTQGGRVKSKLYTPLRDLRRALADMADVPERGRERGRGWEPERQRARAEREHDLWSYRKMFGRKSDEKAVIDFILSSVVDDDDDERVSVVPIIGPPCIGKTALAHLIFTNPRLFHFRRQLWILIGDLYDDDDIVPFWAGVGHEIFKHYPLEKEDDEGDIKQLKMEIQERLQNTRVLIVLDGLRDTPLHMSEARELIDMLAVKGSAVIVTTRSRRAASAIGTIPAYQLQPLSQETSFDLFTYHSVPDPDIIGLGSPVAMEALASEFVNFCCGVPTLLRSVGSYLSTRENWGSFWDKLQNNDLREIAKDFSPTRLPIPPYLRLLLPSFHLAKASSGGGGGGLSVEHLTCIWMALGLLYSSDTAHTPEYIARKYLKDLAETDLCPDVQYAPGGVVQSINFIHVLRDVAAFYADPSWVILRPGAFFGATCVHIIWDQDGRRVTHMPSHCISEPEEVRLFVASRISRLDSSLRFVENVLSSLVRLRVLGLGGCNIEMLPDSISQLRSLRYLDLGRNPRMKSLPDSICDLWNLQTLFLHGCNQLQALPASIGRLQNLRYMTLTILTDSLPEAIGQLTSLRTLGLTNCQSLASLPPSLKNLKNLETLGIVHCPVLDLASTPSVEGFKGLDAIRTLLLSYLPKFAGLPYLGNLNVALQHLQIQACTSLTAAKWITQFGFMRSLTIEACPILSNLMLTDGASQLSALSELVIRSCPNLGYTAWIRQFVFLRSLIIHSCPKLVELDAGFRQLKSLERLEIRGCPVLTRWVTSPAGKDWRRITHIQVIEVDGSRLKF